jgi:GNAT superfamily N-acetyltransferase
MPQQPGQPATIVYCVSPPVANDALNALFAASWPQHRQRNFTPVLEHSLAYIGAYLEDALIGFVNLAWDGGIHAFMLDPTVHPQMQRRGIGRELVAQAAAIARQRGIHWIHVDFEPHLRHFYHQCGFQPTEAGLLWVGPQPRDR